MKSLALALPPYSHLHLRPPTSRKAGSLSCDLCELMARKMVNAEGTSATGLRVRVEAKDCQASRLPVAIVEDNVARAACRRTCAPSSPARSAAKQEAHSSAACWQSSFQ
eukprot:2764009-Amphidinium_carterae.1